MNRSLLPGALALSLFATAASAAPVTLVDDTTSGLYNAGLGTALDGTDPFFQTNTDNSLSLGPADAPDLSAGAAALGDWLANPAAPSGSGWSALAVAIPAAWTVGHETAIIYEIDGGATGLTGVTASFGVDNGIAVWLNGAFVGAEARAGGVIPGEHVFALGDLGAGTHYLQLLREDHGGGTGYTVSVTGEVAAPVPLPAAGLMLAGALGGFAAMRARRR
jgi:hypothetical protein